MSQVRMKDVISAVSQDIRRADDEKLRQIVAVLERSPNEQVRQNLLEPLRPRLAFLAPPRRLQFTRLLFLPVEDLIVQTPQWLPGSATVPRSAMAAIGSTVRQAMTDQAAEIDQMVTGQDTANSALIDKAGRILWARGATILAEPPSPVGWNATGLRADVYPSIARATSTVLRRADALRSVVRDTEQGGLKLDEQALSNIIASLTGEPQEGCTMVFKLVFRRLPGTLGLLKHLCDAKQNAANRAILWTAMRQATNDVLSELDGQSRLTDALASGPMVAVGFEVQRISTLLQTMNETQVSPKERARLHGIRNKVDAVCRTRVAQEIKSDLIDPLASAAAGSAIADQTALEQSARDIRYVETTARKLGSAAAYDSLLTQATNAVQGSAEAGGLNLAQATRLTEILAGSDAADALYRKALASKPAATT